jgi:hypothetical protein
MHPSAAQVLTVVIAAVILPLLQILQTRRASRFWLRGLPGVLRNRISSYFEPRPAVHPYLPNPDEIQLQDDAPAYGRFATNILRAVLSALHGIEDAEFYFTRLAISFFLEAFVFLALFIVLGLIA